jgi:YjbE family integral membrane protein
MGLFSIFPQATAGTGAGLDSVSAETAVHGSLFISSLIIVLVDIVLSGDNSVVIAMAVHSLKAEQRLKGILIGTAGAVTMRILFTWFASRLMETPFLKLAGGGLILWIAVKLLIEETADGGESKKAATLWHAVWIILVADFTMSLDNVLAVAAASKGNVTLLWMGLCFSIPLVIFASTVISTLMDKYPIILFFGAAVLGKVGGEMLITDPVVVDWFQVKIPWLKYVFEALGVAGVLLVALLIKRRRLRFASPTAAAPAGAPPQA